jgi:phage-related protein
VSWLGAAGRAGKIGVLAVHKGEIRRMPLDQPRVRRVRFYRSPETGAAVARREFRDLHTDGQAALLDLFTRFEHDDQLSREVKHVRGDLYEMRAQVGNNPYRALYFADGPRYVVVVMCMYKNQRKLSSTDIDTAMARMNAWRSAGAA